MDIAHVVLVRDITHMMIWLIDDMTLVSSVKRMKSVMYNKK